MRRAIGRSALKSVGPEVGADALSGKGIGDRGWGIVVRLWLGVRSYIA